MASEIEASARAGVGSEIFVGRSAELGQLEAGIADALGNRGRIFLITGDAGIGKSRFAKEVAERAAARGFTALWGRCWESAGAPSFWPWVQALRGYARATGDVCATPVPAAAADQSVPELAALVGASAQALHTADRDQTRFHLFDATTRFLREAMVKRPLLLVLDDLHAADVDSLLLLRFLARELTDIRLLVIGTYRDAEARTHPAVSDVLGDVARDATVLPLRGWSEAEVAQFIAQTVRAPADATCQAGATLAGSVCRITEGNPFFVDEIVRLWNAEGAVPQMLSGGAVALRIPDQVRDTVRRRLALLPPRTREVLGVAAVIGREFDLALLARAVDSAPDLALRNVLDSAAAAAVIVAVPGASERYAFGHALIRDTLYHDHAPVRRAGLHHTVARAIETAYAAALDAHLADLAHHYLAAAGEQTAANAIAYALRAADHATSCCAYADAVAHCEHALEAFAQLSQGDATAATQRRCELLLKLGGAQNAAGQRYQARDTFLQASDLARQLHLPEAFAQAALGYGGSWEGATEVIRLDPPDPTHFDDTLARLLREARELLGDRCPPLRARVLSRLAVELYFTGTPAQRDVLAQEAVTIARRLDDPLALAVVLLDSHMAVWGPDNVTARRAMAEEVVELAMRTNDYGLQLAGRAWLIADLLELGDAPRVEAEFKRYRRLAESYRQPAYLWSVKVHSAQQALLTGAYAAAEQLAQEALTIGQPTLPAAFVAYSVQIAAVQRECGRFAELSAAEAFLRGVCDQYPDIPSPRVALMHLLVLTGRLDDARTEFERIAARNFENLPRDVGWTSVMAELAEVCAGLGDTECAAALYRLLLPCGAYVVVTPYHATCWGSVARSLGMLAAMIGDWAAAEAHFAVALECNRRLGARPWMARTQYHYAAMLGGRAQPGDHDKARTLLDEAQATAEELGMLPLVERIIDLRSRLATTPDTSSPAAAILHEPAAELTPNRFARKGEFWQIAYGGESCSLKHTRGAQFIAHLLRYPQQEFHALDLVQTVDATAEREDHAPAKTSEIEMARGDTDAGEMLDPHAKAAYKRRIEELRDELSEAQAFNDLGRAERAQEEIAFLTQELTRAFGLGGRERRAGSHAERARVNVTRSIAIALKQIDTHHPALAQHLKKTIKTGTFCSYNPDPRVPIAWTV